MAINCEVDRVREVRVGGVGSAVFERVIIGRVGVISADDRLRVGVEASAEVGSGDGVVTL